MSGWWLAAASLVAALGCSPASPPPVTVPPADLAIAPAPPAPALVATEEPQPPSPPEGPPSPAEDALREWSPQSACPDFDYFPEGGLRSFWCHRPSRLSVSAVRALAGVPLFLSGPHRDDDLALASPSSFGHYQPAFVRWLVEKAGPSPRGSAAQRVTQAGYDKNLRPLARIFWATLGKAKGDAECFKREEKAYSDLIASKRLPRDYYERWFYFMNPFFCDRSAKPANFYYDNGFDAGVNGNVTKTVVGFWLRRSMDGTMTAFAEGLEKLIASYDPELLAPRRGPDGPALTRALEAAVRAAGTCKDPKARQPSLPFDIAVDPAGKLKASVRGVWRSSPAASCIEQNVAAASLTVPAFDGEALSFHRAVTVR